MKSFTQNRNTQRITLPSEAIEPWLQIAGTENLVKFERVVCEICHSGTMVERRSLNFPCPTLDLQLTGDHLCGQAVRYRSAN